MEQEITDEIEREEYSLEDYAGEDGDEPEYDDLNNKMNFKTNRFILIKSIK